MYAIIAGIVIIILIFLIIYLFRKPEKFTNEAGYYADTNKCSSMTLRDCLNCANCAWCMKKDFDSQCVAGLTDDLLKSGKCDKVYANDVWTRAILSADNDYRDSLDLPIFE